MQFAYFFNCVKYLPIRVFFSLLGVQHYRAGYDKKPEFLFYNQFNCRPNLHAFV